MRIDRLLVHTITMAGLAAMVAASYLLIVLGLGRSPDRRREDAARPLDARRRGRGAAVDSRCASGSPSSRPGASTANGTRPTRCIRTFGSRLTRALPLDELLLQLAESLKKTMSLSVAEVWTRGATGRLERAVSVPDRGPATLALGAEEETVVARAGVSGPAWARIWLPQLITADDEVLRVAPITNCGELLGLIVVRRPDGALPFDEHDDQALTELARQVGLALHNVKLDSALQESLDEVRRQADELRASRARIVEAADAQRRRIERDLHDGAQQHLVALAVSVQPRAPDRRHRSRHRQVDARPDRRATSRRRCRSCATSRTASTRRCSWTAGSPRRCRPPPGRAALPTGVEAEGIGRYPQQVEAAVYFCCLEALQNAAKHAGDGAEAMITVWEDEGALLFEVRDNGAGFDLASGAHEGHGFVNMSDRVGRHRRHHRGRVGARAGHRDPGPDPAGRRAGSNY